MNQSPEQPLNCYETWENKRDPDAQPATENREMFAGLQSGSRQLKENLKALNRFRENNTVTLVLCLLHTCSLAHSGAPVKSSAQQVCPISSLRNTSYKKKKKVWMSYIGINVVGGPR